jgi:hypothetical protein
VRAIIELTDWESVMAIRLFIAALVFMMVQAVLFGVGAVLVLATPLSDSAMRLMPWVVVISTVISAPASWAIAPRLRARYWRQRNSGESSATA